MSLLSLIFIILAPLLDRLPYIGKIVSVLAYFCLAGRVIEMTVKAADYISHKTKCLWDDRLVDKIKSSFLYNLLIKMIDIATIIITKIRRKK